MDAGRLPQKPQIITFKLAVRRAMGYQKLAANCLGQSVAFLGSSELDCVVLRGRGSNQFYDREALNSSRSLKSNGEQGMGFASKLQGQEKQGLAKDLS